MVSQPTQKLPLPVNLLSHQLAPELGHTISISTREAGKGSICQRETGLDCLSQIMIYCLGLSMLISQTKLGHDSVGKGAESDSGLAICGSLPQRCST